MRVLHPVKSRTDDAGKKFETLTEVISEADKKVIMCEAVNCFAHATNTIEVKAGNHRTILLSLCKNCVCKFVGDD